MFSVITESQASGNQSGTHCSNIVELTIYFKKFCFLEKEECFCPRRTFPGCLTSLPLCASGSFLYRHNLFLFLFRKNAQRPRKKPKEHRIWNKIKYNRLHKALAISSIRFMLQVIALFSLQHCHLAAWRVSRWKAADSNLLMRN